MQRPVRLSSDADVLEAKKLSIAANALTSITYIVPEFEHQLLELREMVTRIKALKAKKNAQVEVALKKALGMKLD